MDALTESSAPVDQSLCLQCGRCCWDWKGGGEAGRCEELQPDGRCGIHDRLMELRPECVAFPTPHQMCDLPEDCGYVLYWRERGIVGAHG